MAYTIIIRNSAFEIPPPFRHPSTADLFFSAIDHCAITHDRKFDPPLYFACMVWKNRIADICFCNQAHLMPLFIHVHIGSSFAKRVWAEFQRVKDGLPKRGPKRQFTICRACPGIVKRRRTPNVTSQTHCLVVGSGGACYDRKVETKVDLRKSGRSILFGHESDFCDPGEDIKRPKSNATILKM